MAQPTLLSIETLRFTKAPFATDVFALGVHFRGAPRSDAITVKHRACVVLVAQVCEGKGAFLARIKTRVSSAFGLWNHGSKRENKQVFMPSFCAWAKYIVQQTDSPLAGSWLSNFQ